MLPIYLNSIAIFLILLLAYFSDVLSKAGFRPSIEEIAYTYLVVYISTSVGGLWLLAGSIGRALFLAYQEPFKTITEGLRPPFWAPPAKCIAQILTSSIQVDWFLWILPLLYWFILSLTACILSISAARVLAPMLIDLEEMPFPTIVLYRGIRESIKEEDFLRKVFLFSTAISFLINLPTLIRLAVPWFPLLPFPQAYGYTMTIDLTAIRELRVFTMPNAVIVLSVNPLWIAACYLLPLDTLLTWWIVYVVLNVVYPLIAVYLGLLPPMTPPFGAQKIWVFQNFKYGPLKPYIAFTVGGLAALGVTAFIKLLILTKRTAKKFSYLLVASCIALAVFSSMNYLTLRSLSLSLATSFITLTMYLGALSLLGESFIIPVMLSRPMNAALGQYLSEYLALSSPEAFSPQHILGVLLLGEASYSLLSPGVALLESFALLRTRPAVKKSPREIRRTRNRLAKLAILVVALSLFSSYYTMILVAHEYSIANLPGLKTIIFEYGKAEADFLMNAAKIMVDENWWISFTIGAVSIALVSLLRLKLLVFPLCPVGLVLSASELSLYGMWFSALIAYTLKRTTLALGGLKLYMREGRAIAAGIIVGYSLSYIVASALSYALYFIH